MKTTETVPEPGEPLLEIAVVGHTNTGKTSLIRTMLRSVDFGKVEDAAGTTRHVERATIFAQEEAILHLHDTPGIEDVYALQEKLATLTAKRKQSSPREILQQFVSTVTFSDPLEQEAKVIRQVLLSDVLLYVIDVREPVLEKYLVEIEVLSKAMIPIIPVFNFVAEHRSGLDIWRAKLAAFHIHASLELDTVAFTFEAEKRLYQKIQSLAEVHYTRLQRLINYRAQVWRTLCHSAAKRIAALIVTAACHRELTGEDPSANQVNEHVAAENLRNFVRQAEQNCLQDLLKLFNFTDNDVVLHRIPIQDGHWELDLFAPGVLKAYGLDIGSAALKGAAAGAGIDLLTGGLSLGTASMLGALVGTGWSTFRRYGREIQAMIQKARWLCVDDSTLRLLYLRQRELLEKLTHRGHAAIHVDEVTQRPNPSDLPAEWSEMIAILRQNPAWGEATDLQFNHAQYNSIEKDLINSLLKSTNA